jgi:type II secretory pathway component GspD/PulD (secretin)
MGGYGGGGMGGYGGGGMGGYGGGGMGGGMGGYGGGGMGMMGGGMGMMGGQIYETEADKLYRMYQLGQLIIRTISPGTWNQIVIQQLGGATGVGTGVGGAGIGVGGNIGVGQPVGAGGAVGAATGTEETINDPTRGTIEFYQGKYMVVRHTIDVQKQIEKLLDDMRVALSEQVSIEARFLIVTENFLEDLGVDIDIKYDPGAKGQDRIDFDQSSYDATSPTASKVPGSMAGTLAGVIRGGSGNIMLDDLQVDFLIRATQAHRDSKILTAPKVTVLSGEMAAIEVRTAKWYPQSMVSYSTAYGTYGGGFGGGGFQPVIVPLELGPVLNVIPTITKDKKHVLLNIVARVDDLISMETYDYQIPSTTTGGQPTPATIQLPTTEGSMVQTRVSVPDGGTLLLGGLKITAEEEKEVGVPILSKIPILGRAFDNRSKIKDNKILLILVKPTIILQKEKDVEAISALELPGGV